MPWRQEAVKFNGVRRCRRWELWVFDIREAFGVQHWNELSIVGDCLELLPAGEIEGVLPAGPRHHQHLDLADGVAKLQAAGSTLDESPLSFFVSLPEAESSPTEASGVGFQDSPSSWVEESAVTPVSS